jgi:magnesium and cobalt transporter
VTDTSSATRPRQTEADGEPIRQGRLIHRLRHMFGFRNGEHSVRETLEELIEDRDEPEAPIARDERELLKNILSLRDITVYDVMVPRAHIIAVELGTSFQELVALMSDAAHSRLPVFRETLDDVIGMVHIKDVLAASQKKKPDELEKLLRPVLFVPPSMPALDLLLDMRVNRTHLSLVVDEYGGIDGLVTIEDLVEQIVGEIEDEHDDAPAPALTREADGTILAEGSLPIEELEEVTGPFLTEQEEEEIDTLGGLVVTLAGRVPTVGERFTHPSGVEFEVVGADPRRVGSVRLSNLPPRPSEDG